MADSPEAIRKSLRLYKMIGGVLFAGTIITVLVASVEALDIGEHGFDKWDMILGLTIATIKASLVAAIFMHLNHEKRLIYWLFGLGIGAAICLVGLVALAESDPIRYNGFKIGVPGSDTPALEVSDSK
jgi:caa(3)-type oxidase subunit IV